MYNQSNLAEIEREEQVQVFQFPDMSGSSEFTQEDLEDDRLPHLSPAGKAAAGAAARTGENASKNHVEFSRSPC